MAVHYQAVVNLIGKIIKLCSRQEPICCSMSALYNAGGIVGVYHHDGLGTAVIFLRMSPMSGIHSETYRRYSGRPARQSCRNRPQG